MILLEDEEDEEDASDKEINAITNLTQSYTLHRRDANRLSEQLH